MAASEENELELLRKKAYYLEVVSTFAALLLEAKTESDIVWSVAKHAVAKLGYEDCVVYIRTGDTLYQRAAHGPKNPIDLDILDPITIKVGEGIVGTVAQSGKGEIVMDTSKDDRYIKDDDTRLSEIAVPIMAKDQILGVIDSENKKAGFYSEDDLNVLTTIASMAATKLQEVAATEQILAHRNVLKEAVDEKTRTLEETIAQLKHLNDEITAQNKEKEMLIKEVHHRVKNNLQILSSLMRLQANTSTSEEAIEVFRECGNRILSMAAIHEQLYSTGDMTHINARQYISEITDDLLRSFGVVHQVKLNFDVEEQHFDLDTSIPLGLILNELLVNTIKHGIREKDPEVGVQLQCSNGVANFRVEDNGPGFDPDEHGNGSLGMELIHTLTDQLDGTIELDSDDTGTRWRLSFPIERQ